MDRIVATPRRLLLTVLAAGIVLGAVVGGGVATTMARVGAAAAITPPVVHACISGYGAPVGTAGAVRIIPATQQCSPLETALDWNRGVGSCAPNQFIQSLGTDGSTGCAAHTAGSGLSLSGLQFSTNPAQTQNRVTGTCASGSSIQTIGQDGSVTCETDQNTTYTAGPGLTLSGTQFSADTSYLQRRVTGTCSSGSSIRTIAQDGTVTCETDTTGFSAVQVVSGTFSVACCAFNVQTFDQPCPSGTTLISGGFTMTQITLQHVWASRPAGNSWRVVATQDLGSDDLVVYAICTS